MRARLLILRFLLRKTQITSDITSKVRMLGSKVQYSVLGPMGALVSEPPPPPPPPPHPPPPPPPPPP